jgi:hypothetical protein
LALESRSRSRGNRPAFLGAAALLVAVAGFGPPRALAADTTVDQATPTPAGTFRPLIVNGVVTSSYPAIGALLLYDDASDLSLYGLCSGTLIGCHTFLTAAHCVCPERATDAASCERQGLADPATLRVFLQQGGIFRVANVTISPQFSFAERSDVAIVNLGERVSGIAPSPINTVRRPQVRTGGTIVGFGTTMAGRFSVVDAGIKREGAVTTAQCPSDIPADSQLCWMFLGGGANACEGDSGGPLFADFGEGPMVAGVTSGGESFNCLAPDVGFDTDVFVNRAWLADAAGADLGTESCGLPALGGASTATFTDTGQLDSTSPEARFQFEVPKGTTVLRVSLNGQLGSRSGFPSTFNDFDVFLRANDSPSTDTFDCADTNPTPFGFCEMPSPRAGIWHALVRLNSGDGVFQITATTFASASPVACSGDCNDDGVVTVGDVIEGVRIALGGADLASCPAFDANSDGIVTVDDVLVAVTSVLSGCRAS